MTLAENSIFTEAFNILKMGNPLYEGVETLTERTMAKFVISLKDNVEAKSALLLEDQSEMEASPMVTKDDNDLYVRIAIASMFTLLFSIWTFKKNTRQYIRERTKSELGLLLQNKNTFFCFDLIISSENYYLQRFVKPKQPRERNSSGK